MAGFWARVDLQALCLLTTPRPARVHELDEPAHHHMKPLLPSQGASNSLLLQRFRALAIGRSWCSHTARTSNVSDKASANGR